MTDQIATIQEFLTRGEIRLARGENIYQILSIDGTGRADVIRNPQAKLERDITIVLTEKEIASLAASCFPRTPWDSIARVLDREDTDK